MKVAVVGGGLAGLAAALDLVDAGACGRPSTRRGRRSAAPSRRCPSARAIRSRRPTTGSTSRSAASPSTCASSSGSAKAARTCARGSRCPCSTSTGWSRRSSRAFAGCSGTGTCRCGTGSDSRSPRCAAHCAVASERDVRTAARRLGDTDAIDRPVLGRVRAAGAQPPLRRGRRGGGPLHGPHRAARPAREQRPDPPDEAARRRCTATRPGAALGDRVRRCYEARVESLDELDADAVVVAVPPRESARLLGEDGAGSSRTRRS